MDTTMIPELRMGLFIFNPCPLSELSNCTKNRGVLSKISVSKQPILVHPDGIFPIHNSKLQAEAAWLNSAIPTRLYPHQSFRDFVAHQTLLSHCSTKNSFCQINHHKCTSPGNGIACSAVTVVVNDREMGVFLQPDFRASRA